MDIDPGDLNHETNVYEVTTSNVLSQGFLFCLGKPNEVDGNIVYSMYSVNPDKSINKRIGTYTVPSDKTHLGDLSMKGFDALDAFTTIGEPTLIEDRKGKIKKSKSKAAEEKSKEAEVKDDKNKEAEEKSKEAEEKTDKEAEEKTDKEAEEKTEVKDDKEAEDKASSDIISQDNESSESSDEGSDKAPKKSNGRKGKRAADNTDNPVPKNKKQPKGAKDDSEKPKEHKARSRSKGPKPTKGSRKRSK